VEADGKPPPPCPRAGETVLSLIAAPLTVPILGAHRDGPLRLSDLHERIGGVAQTTFRGQVAKLRRIGALERHVRGGMPYAVDNKLTDVGRAILGVASVVQAWLARAPGGSIQLGSEQARVAVKALVYGWGSTVLRVLAARPLSLTELDGVIADLSYPSLERRLSAMRAARQIEPQPSGGGSAKRYGVTKWTRQAVAPLLAAGRCECQYLDELTEELTRVDVEAAFLLAVPLVDLGAARSGSCSLVVDTGLPERHDNVVPVARIHVGLEEGAVVSCVSRLEPKPRTWVRGGVEAWTDALLDGRLEGLHWGGEDVGLARDLVTGLHTSLSAA
jgi:DNA-binding HxlR family transcriptional regulator